MASPELMASPEEKRGLGREGEVEENIYGAREGQPMEFEVEVSQKFESLGKGKSLSSNRTNKFNFGEKKQSASNILGESDYTIGKNLRPREFNNKTEEKEVEGSSEEEEDLIVGNSVTIEPDLLEADETLPEKEESKDDLEALESLSRDLQQKEDANYLTMKLEPCGSELVGNFSQNELEEKKLKSVKKWKGKRGRREKKGKPSRSNSRIKLYKMTSERNSTVNNSVKKRARHESKTKWSQKKARKQEINKLYEKYSKEDNYVEDGPSKKKASRFDQVNPVAFSSTFGTNLQQQIRKAKKKPQKNKKAVDKEAILKKCKEFKHETQSNLFEVETLNTLTRGEDDYVAKPEYLSLNQPFLDAKVRTVLMGWMGEVSEDLWFCRDTFHMSCNYVDRFLQITPNVAKDQLQLIGLTCLYIASKMEEVQMRNVNDYLSSACNIYTEEQMMNCEINIITTLDFKLNPPTLNLWANWYMNQWDNFIMSDSFVQEHPMIRDSCIVVQFKQGNEQSYNLYREFMQYLGTP